jgi:serine/threonine-protein kinase
MAPEVWAGTRGPADEQYSLAATYVEARLGHPPFVRPDFVTLMQAQLDEQPDLDGLPGPERRAVGRALAKVPTDRYATCGALARAIGECLG